ncbi:flagellar basal body P-ring formation chaperone FlgA [Candidatus Puniceispirillum sp.]|nr:flagellar basal body P-ring formation chaperone FlgA [Candidatus Puniceispirillum sp.]
MKYFSLVDKNFFILVVISCLFFGLSNNTMAAEMISGAEIKKKINAFLIKKDFMGEPLISETRLFPACLSDILIRPMFGGLKTVELFCSDPGGLKIAVRTNAVSIVKENIGLGLKKKSNYKSENTFNFEGLRSQDSLTGEQLSKKFLALSRSVQKGQVLTVKDVVFKNTKSSNLSGYFTNISDVVGRKVKKNLSINQVLLSRHLEINWDIQKGQKILIQSAAGSVVVVSSGISRKNAQIGELLQVKNLQSGALVEGIVVSQNKIKVLTK